MREQVHPYQEIAVDEQFKQSNFLRNMPNKIRFNEQIEDQVKITKSYS